MVIAKCCLIRKGEEVSTACTLVLFLVTLVDCADLT